MSDYDEARAEEARGNLPTTGRIEIHDEAIEAAAEAMEIVGHFAVNDVEQLARRTLDASGLPQERDRLRRVIEDVPNLADDEDTPEHNRLYTIRKRLDARSPRGHRR